MENKSGSGFTSPFGNEQGATSQGPATGANNFLENPKGNSTPGTGRDFTKEHLAQKPGAAPVDEQSKSATILPYPEMDALNPGAMGTGVAPSKPFKLNG